MSWYLEDIRRLRDERESVDALAVKVDWLRPIRWHMDSEFRLIFEAEIVTEGRSWPITLQYPKYFPHQPPLVLPRGDATRWSSHQYGASGELCLEYGPDNWSPNMTGVMMLKSAHRLLAAENPEDGSKGTVPTRHSLTLGQELRSSGSRLVITDGLKSLFDSVPVNAQYLGNAVVRFTKPAYIYMVYNAGGDKSTPSWRDARIPEILVQESFERNVSIIRIAPEDDLPPRASVDHLCDPLKARGFTIEPGVLIILRGDDVYPYVFYKDDQTVYKLTAVLPQPASKRLDDEHQTLVEKRVVIVGCGSMGSKVATSLARAGVGFFVLVDDDVLLHENLVRNDLDLREVGSHKVDSLARRLEFVNPSVTVLKSKHRIGAQEASSAVGALLELFEGSDLIIDATADPSVFNALSALPKTPLIWGEIFGGGIGGLIARYRPSIEPTPQFMRRAIENWFQEFGVPKPVPAVDYGGQRGDGPPMIADDADVSVIAAHVARYAVDLLIKREPSMFPASAYAIGLAKENIFNAPFETYPIDVGPAGEETASNPLPADEAADEVKKIVEIVANYAAEAQAAADSNKKTEN